MNDNKFLKKGLAVQGMTTRGAGMRGGLVKGPGTGTSDSVPAVNKDTGERIQLSNKEFVLPADTVRKVGAENLQALIDATHDNPEADARASAKAARTGMRHMERGGPTSSGWTYGQNENQRWTGKPNGPMRTMKAPPQIEGPRPAAPQAAPRLPGPAPSTALVDLKRPNWAPPNQGAPSAPIRTVGIENPNVGNGVGSKEAFKYQAERNAQADRVSARPQAAPTMRQPWVTPPGDKAKAVGKAIGRVAGPLGGLYEMGTGISEGDGRKVAVGALDTAAGAALFTPAAPVAGPYLAARGLYEGGKAAAGAINSGLSESARDTIGGTINQGVRNVGALFGKDWGTDDSAYLQSQAEQRLGAPTPTPAQQAAAPAEQDMSVQGPPTDLESLTQSKIGLSVDAQREATDVSTGPEGTTPQQRANFQLAQQGVRRGPETFNLGNYDGNATIYGQATNGSNKVNSFSGVGDPNAPAYRDSEQYREGMRVAQADRDTLGRMQSERKEREAEYDIQGLRSNLANARTGQRKNARAMLEGALNDRTTREGLRSAESIAAGTQAATMYKAQTEAETAAATARRDQANKDRDFGATQGNLAFQRGETAEKNLVESLEKMYVDRDGKTDAARVASARKILGDSAVESGMGSWEQLKAPDKERLVTALSAIDHINKNAGSIPFIDHNKLKTVKPHDLIDMAPVEGKGYMIQRGVMKGQIIPFHVLDNDKSSRFFGSDTGKSRYSLITQGN